MPLPFYYVWPARMLDCFNTRVRASVKARARRAARVRTPMPSCDLSIMCLQTKDSKKCFSAISNTFRYVTTKTEKTTLDCSAPRPPYYFQPSFFLSVVIISSSKKMKWRAIKGRSKNLSQSQSFRKKKCFFSSLSLQYETLYLFLSFSSRSAEHTKNTWWIFHEFFRESFVSFTLF